MNVKVIVKVMNFHALLRVDASRRRAEKYFQLEREVAALIGRVMNNRNFLLDKKVLRPDAGKPALNLYIGSDYGFCGSINAGVNGMLLSDAEGEKIVIGKKLRAGRPGELLRQTREQFAADRTRVEAVLSRSVGERSHSEINVIYNHYHNTGSIELRRKRIFPLEREEDRGAAHTEDFAVEGDANELLADLVRAYLSYEVRIAAVNSFAAENIMRQNATSDSLKKIEEQEELERLWERRERTREEFARVIDSYLKKQVVGGKGA